MNETAGSADAENQSKTEAVEGQALAKIEPVKIATSDVPDAEVTETETRGMEINEASLLDATRTLLRSHGVRKSAAAVREAVETPHDTFEPAQAVSALSSLGFKSSFGSLKLEKLGPEFFPLIAFAHDGNAIVLHGPIDEELVRVSQFGSKGKIETVSSDTVTSSYSGYVILATELNDGEKEQRNGHWFFSAFRKSKWIYIQVMIAAMVSNFLSLTTSLFTMTVYDRIIPNGAFESLIALSFGVVIALGFDFLIKSLRASFIDVASKRADLEISRRLFDRILTLSPAEQRQKTGAMAGTIREFETLREFFNSSTLVILIDLPFVFFFIYVIYLIAGPLAYVPLVAVPVVMIVGLGIQPFLARITKGSVESGMNKQAVLVETLNGLETVTATGSGKLMKKRYEDALNNQSNSGNKIRALSMFIVNFAASVQQYAQVGSIFFGVYLIVEGTITQGALIGAVILGGRTMSPLSQLANTLSRANGALTAYRNLDKLIGSKFNSAANLSPISRPTLSGEIEFRNVSYKFEGASQPVLNNLSFKIPVGQKVALVGKMGSGKSTLSRLIAGIYEPTEGAILIDGVDVRQIDQADIRKNIGIMLQESWLFSGTIRENIQMGYNEYDDDHLLRVCKIAGVDDFVGSHPKGYDLEIKERGKGLSGGQLQTINLARSLLHNPNIILLDEPTSSMDQGSEKKVVAALQEACADKTMLIVTHRNPILTMVDRVFVLENGTVVADQTPQQLGLKKN
ncbi:MAG: type I secretion system permease/ATPase [Betaproteobacteria bacterium]|jgi:ATP-binding cassette subfamily C protein LapB|nr:type I secretion system permease/ATPase [Betaproteobacteria bacterium]